MTRIEFKPGAEPQLVHEAILIKLPDILKVFAFHGYKCICTCTTGSHKPDNPHSHGLAWDFRTYHIPDQDAKERLADRLQEVVGPLYYVEYDPGDDDPATDEVEHDGEHIHLQVRRDLWRNMKTV